MKAYKYTGTGNNGTIAWVLQRISAIVLVIALGYHLLGKLMTKAGGGIFEGSNSFLMAAMWLFVTCHAFNGLKMVTDDYVSRKGVRFILYLIYWALALIILGLSKSLF